MVQKPAASPQPARSALVQYKYACRNLNPFSFLLNLNHNTTRKQPRPPAYCHLPQSSPTTLGQFFCLLFHPYSTSSSSLPACFLFLDYSRAIVSSYSYGAQKVVFASLSYAHCLQCLPSPSPCDSPSLLIRAMFIDSTVNRNFHLTGRVSLADKSTSHSVYHGRPSQRTADASASIRAQPRCGRTRTVHGLASCTAS